MRGKAENFPVQSGWQGITPAYAGKRGVCDMILYVWQDHPRLCGEKRSIVFRTSLYQGSPPPMRGKGFSSYGTAETGRITPAYAGKREQIAQNAPRIKDHPRLCGEKTKKIPKQRYFFHQPASFSFSLQYT